MGPLELVLFNYEKELQKEQQKKEIAQRNMEGAMQGLRHLGDVLSRKSAEREKIRIQQQDPFYQARLKMLNEYTGYNSGVAPGGQPAMPVDSSSSGIVPVSSSPADSTLRMGRTGLNPNYIMTGRGNMFQNAGQQGTTTDDEIMSSAEGIASGRIPPNISQTVSFRDRTRVTAALEKKGFNLSEATSEWNATQKFLSSINNEKQIRLRQAITSVKDALGGLEELNTELSRGEVAPLNKAQLVIQANSGDPLAVKYLGQINIIQDELAQVFMGGNSPTDRALQLAAKTLQSNWSTKQLQAAIDNVKINLGYRENAINYAAVQGTNPGEGGGTRYLPVKENPMLGNRFQNTGPQRIRVKSPKGQVGTIPVDQLQDALSQGYQQVR
jgi:hypothetical protein